ncbi:MAG TPA: zinc-ribbon domain-containing protein [Longimicrobiaceae bacterium]|nr:zinc-ribbon domain-containing protein [Longimicrobiaceae bacterium]
MNAACTHCHTVFRVDPRKVPAGGARVRCSICRGVFRVEPAGERTEERTMLAVSAPAAASTPPVAPAPPTPPAAAPAPTVEVPSGATPSGPRPGAPSPFGATDPHSKARRLARALVSDMVTYHPERRDTALRDGTLKREFKEEIRKSWEEYVQQVGTEVAHGTTFFRDALNDILARGQKIF